MNYLVANNRLTTARPDYVHDVQVGTHAAADLYPSKILNTAVNFFSHVGEGGGDAEAQKKAVAARAAREPRRAVLFLKPGEGVVIGNGDNVVLPYGRDRIDWEVELGDGDRPHGEVRPGTKSAQDYIFGYMVMIDISDRGGRPPGGFSSGSDWFVGKGHDTFGPMGPWIVPKEFYGDPMKNLRQTLTVGDDADAGRHAPAT